MKNWKKGRMGKASEEGKGPPGAVEPMTMIYMPIKTEVPEHPVR